MTPDLVSRASVEAMMQREMETARKCNMPAAVIGLSTVLAQIKELPSVSAPSGEAVAWQVRRYSTEEGDEGWGMWQDCKEAHAKEFARDPYYVGKVEVRALCVISDTPPGEK